MLKRGLNLTPILAGAEEAMLSLGWAYVGSSRIVWGCVGPMFGTAWDHFRSSLACVERCWDHPGTMVREEGGVFSALKRAHPRPLNAKLDSHLMCIKGVKLNPIFGVARRGYVELTVGSCWDE